MTGKFIAFEGGGGSGKDTQIDLLKEVLPDEQFVREPGGTEIGERIRSILLSDDWDNMSVETELLLFVSARAQLLHEVVKPALAAGRHVISSRFGLSTIAYQIYGREREKWLPLLEKINQLALGDIKPDLYIFLDVPPEIGLERTYKRVKNNRYNYQEDLDFHRRVYRGFHRALEGCDHKLIDGTLPVEVIHRQILEELHKLTGLELGGEPEKPAGRRCSVDRIPKIALPKGVI